MPNFNKRVETCCPRCRVSRLTRADVVKKAQSLGRELFCKTCRNQTRFEDKPHPRAGTGIKNDPVKAYAYRSYARAKKRAADGGKHHPAYENVKFLFESFEQFFAEVGPRPAGCSIDRINPLGNYAPGNVRWATVAQQAQNRMPRNYWRAVREGKTVTT